MKTIQDASSAGDIVGLCDALGVSRASYYRWLRPRHGAHRARTVPRALREAERTEVLRVLHEERFVDKSPV